MAAVLFTGVARLVYVVFGGTLATTWVQIIKAVLPLVVGSAMCIAVLWRFGFNPLVLFQAAADSHTSGNAYVAPGVFGANPLNTVCSAVACAIGTAALPYILIRFFTVLDGHAARRSVGWAVAIIGAFFVMTSIIGHGPRAILPAGSEKTTGGEILTAPLACAGVMRGKDFRQRRRHRTSECRGLRHHSGRGRWARPGCARSVVA